MFFIHQINGRKEKKQRNQNNIIPKKEINKNFLEYTLLILKLDIDYEFLTYM